MKRRKIVIIVLIVLAIVLLGTGCYWCVISDEKKTDTTMVNTDDKEEINKIDSVSKVCFGSLDSSYCGKGTVVSDENEYMDNYKSSTVNGEKIKCNVHMGQFVKKGTILFRVGNRNITVNSNGMIAEIISEDDKIEINVINEERLYTIIDIPYDYFCSLNYKSKVKVLVDGEERNGSIKQIGYKLEEDKVKIKVGFEGYVMPGREVDVELSLGKTPKILFVPSEMVTSVGGVNYCYQIANEESNEVIESEVDIGKTYTVVEDGNEFSYTEIISGLSEGDKIATLKNSADFIDKNL